MANGAFKKLHQAITDDLPAGAALKLYLDFLEETKNDLEKESLGGDAIQFERIKGKWLMLTQLISRLDNELKGQKVRKKS